MAPQVSSRVADAAGQLDEAEGRVVAHHLHDADDLVKRQLRAREYRPSKRAEPLPAAGAPPPRPSLRGLPVLERLSASALGAWRHVPPDFKQTVDLVGAVFLSAPPRPDGVFQIPQLALVERVDKARKVDGVVGHGVPLTFRCARTTISRNVAKQSRRWPFGRLCLAGAIVSDRTFAGLPMEHHDC